MQPGASGRKHWRSATQIGSELPALMGPRVDGPGDAEGADSHDGRGTGGGGCRF